MKPLAPERFALQPTIGKDTHDKLRHAQALLSHALPSGDLAQVFDRAPDALVGQLEKRKFAATTKPRLGTPRPGVALRHVPAHVKRAVLERDQGRCTFVGEKGHRCGSRGLLQFDHIVPVARGGQATVENLRLRCRGHNLCEAERAFGAGFMRAKREEARRLAAEAKARAAEASRWAAAEAEARAAEARGRAAAEVEARAEAEEHARDLTTCLQELGFRAVEARRAVEHCATLQDATLEQRVRAALAFLCPRPRRVA